MQDLLLAAICSMFLWWFCETNRNRSKSEGCKKLNELHACYWILARTIYDAVSHSWRNPMTYSCHFFACEYFCTSKWVPLFHLFSRNINVKKHERNHWKTQTMTTYDILIFFVLYISRPKYASIKNNFTRYLRKARFSQLIAENNFSSQMSVHKIMSSKVCSSMSILIN